MKGLSPGLTGGARLDGVDAYLVDAVRTPFGRHRGGLAGVRTDDLAATPLAKLSPPRRLDLRSAQTPSKLSPPRRLDLRSAQTPSMVRRLPALDPAMIDDVILGDTNGAGEDNRNVARMAVLLAGLPPTVPAVIAVWEINEAFAAMVLSCLRERRRGGGYGVAAACVGVG